MNDIESQVCDDIKSRQKVGIKKYGTTVAESDIRREKWMQHAYEEMLDAAVYMKRIMSDEEAVQTRFGLMLDEILDQKLRIEQLIEDHPPGTFQHRLAETLLDVLAGYEQSQDTSN